jgi:glycosyltransferase involved in cell wall biosynthesis
VARCFDIYFFGPYSAGQIEYRARSALALRGPCCLSIAHQKGASDHMKKIVVITQAYNAEKTLARAIESVLNQTYQNIKYYILDSASTDNTWDIIEEYAQKDERVVPLQNSFNRLTAYADRIPQLLEENEPDSVFAMLDADDTYELDAFEKMMDFMLENDLDIAVCGFKLLNASSMCVFGERRATKDPMILENNELAYLLPTYFMYVRNLCSKFISFPVLKQCCFDRMADLIFCANTIFSFEALKYSVRTGITAQTLYNYTISSDSTDHVFTPQRVNSDQILHNEICKFLAHFGSVTEHNKNYLRMVYFNMMKDSTTLTINAALSANLKITYLREIYSHTATKESYALDQLDSDSKFNAINALFNDLFSCTEFNTKEDFVSLAYLFMDIDLVFDYIVGYKNVIYSLLKGELQRANLELIRLLTCSRNDTPNLRTFILLGQKIATFLGNEGEEVFFRAQNLFLSNMDNIINSSQYLSLLMGK